MNIRHCQTSDLPTVCAIYNHYIRDTVISFEEAEVDVDAMARRLTAYTERYPWLVCVENGEICGYAYACKWQERSAYRHSALVSVYVDEAKRARGIGSLLYEALFAEMRRGDCHVLVAGIALPNAPSVKLHERFGFEQVAHFREVGRKFGQWIDVGYWQKVL